MKTNLFLFVALVAALVGIVFYFYGVSMYKQNKKLRKEDHPESKTAKTASKSSREAH
ncbi:MAG: purine permease [Prevotellaceae bacterium]|jgi:uncharacterized protein YxeA|nr:purine permease [Prevotellaceae bacterium]